MAALNYDVIIRFLSKVPVWPEELTTSEINRKAKTKVESHQSLPLNAPIALGDDGRICFVTLMEKKEYLKMLRERRSDYEKRIWSREEKYHDE